MSVLGPFKGGEFTLGGFEEIKVVELRCQGFFFVVVFFFLISGNQVATWTSRAGNIWHSLPSG